MNMITPTIKKVKQSMYVCSKASVWSGNESACERITNYNIQSGYILKVIYILPTYLPHRLQQTIQRILAEMLQLK